MFVSIYKVLNVNKIMTILCDIVEISKSDRDKSAPSNLPILTLDELLKKELALSYYLDYLSILNLQKYVIFYLTAQGEMHRH